MPLRPVKSFAPNLTAEELEFKISRLKSKFGYSEVAPNHVFIVHSIKSALYVMEELRHLRPLGLGICDSFDFTVEETYSIPYERHLYTYYFENGNIERNIKSIDKGLIKALEVMHKSSLVKIDYMTIEILKLLRLY